MATPIDMEGVQIAMDIEALISKLRLFEITLKNDTKINSTSGKSNTVITTTSIHSDNDFNYRTPEIRDSRMANSLLSLDEDIPQHVDESIKQLLTAHANTMNALGPMEFIVSEDYLEYKQRIAARKATEKKLPRSRGQQKSQTTLNDRVITEDIL
ncbi:hypothetical protein EG329_010719 [Mollisiaceae sp. DMI_Dod_QoI]|nr:hypothetical protein EG329_010719 [Helotiales sp. DMI_Dod_QoI]